MGGIKKEAKISSDALRVLSIILNADGEPKPPANVGEVVLKIHSHLALLGLAKTQEYKAVTHIWRFNKALLAWLGKFYGKYGEFNLKQCSAEERRLVETMLLAYPTFNALREGLDSFFKGSQRNYHRAEKKTIRPSRARK